MRCILILCSLLTLATACSGCPSVNPFAPCNSEGQCGNGFVCVRERGSVCVPIKEGPQGLQGVEGPVGPVGPQGPQGTPGELLSPNGCADGTVDQPFTSDMVGCDCTGTGCVVAARDAVLRCSNAWHICELSEWAARLTVLSLRPRYIRAKVTCSGGCADTLVTGAVDMCEPNTGCSGAYYTFVVGPTEQDSICMSSWSSGVSNGNVSRLGGAFTSKADCLASIATAVGTVCCR